MKNTLTALHNYLTSISPEAESFEPFTSVIDRTGLSPKTAPALHFHRNVPVSLILTREPHGLVGELVLTVAASKELEVLSTPTVFTVMLQPLLDTLGLPKLVSGKSNHRSYVALDLKALPGVTPEQSKVQVCVKGISLGKLLSERAHSPS